MGQFSLATCNASGVMAYDTTRAQSVAGLIPAGFFVAKINNSAFNDYEK